jgi:predicted ATPase
MGFMMHYGGDQPEARRYLERVMSSVHVDASHTAWFQHDLPEVARSTLARVLLLQGFVDQANNQAREGLRRAQSADHSLALPYILAEAVFPIAIMTGEFDAAERALATLIEISSRRDFTYLKTRVKCLQGILHIRRGEFLPGLKVLRPALDDYAKAGGRIFYPECIGVLAEGFSGLGQIAKALDLAEQALERADRDGEGWYVPELLRSKGEMLLRGSAMRSAEAAEDCFLKAFDMAGQQGALYWTLRIASSLAQLRMRQGRHADARTILEPVYGRFTEGFETMDLRAASAMLHSLHAS